MTQKRFFTSDQHFGHTNILKYEDEKRRDKFGNKFLSIDEMDSFIVDQWNVTVAEGDLVYCLGDFCYKMQQMRDVLPFLNGEKILISGNHDPFFKKLNNVTAGSRAYARDLALEAGFSDLHLELEINLPDIGLVRLSHFPYAPTNKEGLKDSELRYLGNRPRVGKESLLLHGHVHSQWQTKQDEGKPLMLNVGVEVWGMRPASEVEIVELFKRSTAK
jgi:calcineurin-like phosphoesterase family protein